MLITEDPDEPFSKNICFMATEVVSGRGKAIVTSTGIDTQVGKVASAMEELRKPTPLHVALNRLGLIIGVTSISVLVFIVVVAVLQDYKDPAHPSRNKIIAILTAAVGSACRASQGVFRGW